MSYSGSASVLGPKVEALVDAVYNKLFAFSCTKKVLYVIYITNLYFTEFLYTSYQLPFIEIYTARCTLESLRWCMA